MKVESSRSVDEISGNYLCSTVNVYIYTKNEIIDKKESMHFQWHIKSSFDLPNPKLP